jgi:hypothetical protein
VKAPKKNQKKGKPSPWREHKKKKKKSTESPHCTTVVFPNPKMLLPNKYTMAQAMTQA